MSNQTFLPEDYLAQKAERRTNLICLVLFVAVMTVVVGAFLFTNRSLVSIKDRQTAINVRYEQAAVQIQELAELEEQKEAMLNKAELAAALVERVPRSILMAELINRMPPRLGLIELKITSEMIKDAPQVQATGTGTLKRKRGPQRGLTREEAMTEAKKVAPPRYHVHLDIVGVAPTDLEVSKYLSELNGYPLLRDVNLKYSESKDIEGREVREFRIVMDLDPDADVRVVDPWTVPRSLKNPMIDTVQYGVPGSPKTTSASPENERGN